MRALPASLVTALQGETTHLVRLVEIVRQDGVTLRLTDAVQNVSYNTQIYRADIGFNISAIQLGLNLNGMQGFTLTSAMTDDGISKGDLRARKYYGATAEVFICDVNDPDNTAISLTKGLVARSTFQESGVAEIEVSSLASDLEQWADEQYSQTCRASLGDTRCKFPIENYKIDFTVTQVVNASQFVINQFSPEAEVAHLLNIDLNYYGFGQLIWTSGGSVGWSMDVLKSDFPTKTIDLFYPPPEPIRVGDTGEIYPGCDRQLSTCHLKFQNAKNFRGEPFAPQWSLA